MADKLGIIVLCTGNSCRSQMAEGFLRHHAGSRFEVYSAGTEPAEHVHPLSLVVMRERGIDISDHQPKNMSEFIGKVPIEIAIIVCDGANQTCPIGWPGAQERLFWPVEDPAGFAGTEEQRLEKFREVRDDLETRIVDWLETKAPQA